MSEIFDVLTKAGYELQNTGNDVLPASLLKDNEPVGFLMPDLTISLVSTKEELRKSLESTINFAIENQGLSTIENEYVLTQYGKTVLTTGYDFDTNEPTYSIYSVDDKGKAIIDSFDNKDIATERFAKLSGLIKSDVTHEIEKNSRIDKFINLIVDKGYKVINSIGEGNRLYDITNSDNDVVGYINKANKLTLTTNKAKDRNLLTDTYLGTNQDIIKLPSFFEKLKNILKELGLALKIKFTAKGQHYSINDKNKEIATIDTQQNLTYTPIATQEQKERIDRIIEDIKLEEKAKANKTISHEEVIQENIVADKSTPSIENEQVVHNETTLSHDDIQALITAVMSVPVITQTLSPELISKLQSLALSKPMIEEPALSTSNDINLSVEQEAIIEEFYGYMDMLHTVEGFNKQKEIEILNDMQIKFGTADTKEFMIKIANGEYTNPKSLADKIKTSSEKANIQNNIAPQEKNKEKAKGKEI